MKLPVDTSSMSFICATSPSPVVDFESRRPKTDENGQPLYVVQLVVLSEGTSEIIAVKVPSRPSSTIRPGLPVHVVGLMAQPWTLADRSGVEFWAARIEPAMPAATDRRSRSPPPKNGPSGAPTPPGPAPERTPQQPRRKEPRDASRA
jgi:hypothetical protein